MLDLSQYVIISHTAKPHLEFNDEIGTITLIMFDKPVGIIVRNDEDNIVGMLSIEGETVLANELGIIEEFWHMAATRFTLAKVYIGIT